MRGHRFIRNTAFDPSQLTLRGWFRGSYSASPWVNIITTGAGDLASASNAPTTGTALNTFVPASFASTLSILQGSSLAGFMSSSAYSGWALVNLTSISTSGYVTPASSNVMICCSQTNNNFAITLDATGPTVTHHVLNGSAVNKDATTSFQTGAWVLVQWRFNSTNIEIRTNTNAWVTTACTSINALTDVLNIGRNTANTTASLNGLVEELGFANTYLSDATFDNLVSYCNTRYGLSLGTFNPSSLSLGGWWQAYPGSSPWSGVASAGGSGSQSLTEPTNPPAAGATLNSLATASFNGTTQKLGGSALSTFMTVSAFSGWALVNVGAVSAGTPTGGNGEILSDSLGTFAVGTRNSGGNKIFVSNFDGAWKGTEVALSGTSTWTLFQWKLDTGSLKCRTDSNTWTSSASGNNTNLGGTLVEGRGRAGVGGGFFTGLIAESGMAGSVISDADFDNIKAYVNARYGLSL